MTAAPIIVDGMGWVPYHAIRGNREEIHRLFTIYPRVFTTADKPEAGGPLPLYTEGENFLGLPREVVRRIEPFLAEPPIYQPAMSMGAPWPPAHIQSVLKPRPEQAEGLKAFEKRFASGRLGGVLLAPCGWGKSAWTCMLIEKLKVPTIVIVHKTTLMNQWKERLREFLPGAAIGTVQGDEIDYKGKHVVVAMLQSLASRTYPPDFYRYFGLLCLDELHRVGARTWAPVPGMFHARYRVGVTATPRRRDQAEDAFWWSFGPVVYEAKEQRMTPQIRRLFIPLRSAPKSQGGLGPMSPAWRYIDLITTCPERSDAIVQRMVDAAMVGRKLIVLSARREHLKDIQRRFTEQARRRVDADVPIPSTSFFWGGLSEEEMEEAEEADVILATLPMASEGLDIPALDTLFLVTPTSDPEQAIGRILRPFPGKMDPIVVDVNDPYLSWPKKQAKKRDEFYEQKGWGNNPLQRGVL